MKESIRSLPGIGDRRQKQYAKLGITTVEDLLRHFPRTYQNRGQVKQLNQIKDGEICPVIVTIATEPRVTPPLKNKIVLLKFRVFDDSASATVTFFQQSYLKGAFRPGMTFRLFGKFRVVMGKIDITSPQFEPVLDGMPLPDYVPVYSLTDGLSQKQITQSVSLALGKMLDSPPIDVIPEGIRQKRGLLSAFEAFCLLHRPRDEEDIARGREYFVYESLYLFSLAIADQKRSRTLSRPPSLKEANLDDFFSSLPFALTPDQLKCIEDIQNDMSPSAKKPMARLVSGDVGSGKTLVAAAAMVRCVRGGCQAMMMAPTEILATQHFKDLSPLLASLGISCELLTGSTRLSEKRRIRSLLAAGEVDVVIGTHALLSEGVRACRLGLVVTDEQHRFGVTQRARLAENGTDPHVLVMSATPIPRSLALILYGDLDVSSIETMPPGRQVVDTFVVDESYRQRLYAFIRKQVDLGGQVYIVCPAIEEQKEEEEEFCVGDFLSFTGEQEEKNDRLHYAIEYAEFLKNRIFPDLKIGCLHGKMKPSDKDEIMSSFASGETKILVSTTVIEVGVNVPSATLMLIENAERFGLSQLHQLRGRVGRGNMKSYCVLVSNAKGDNAKRRLEVLRTMHRGYAIATEDLKLRGPGDFFPTSDGNARQSGDFAIGLASLCTDMDQLQNAAADARETIEIDPTLSLPQNLAAKEEMEKMYQKTKHTIS